MNTPRLKEMFQALISMPSISSVSPEWNQSNEVVIDTLAEWFGNLGFSIEKMPVPGCPGKFNLIASLGKGADGLVLSGHTDTVPYDEQRWNSDPFALLEADDRWYGLGSTDMKGFFALVLEALSEMDLTKLQKPLIVLATADEESTMCGAKSLVDTGQLLGRHAVIGEPTDLMPVRMHKGIAMEAIRIEGQSGHSSNPALGNNAMEGMHLAIAEIMRWRTELQQQYQNTAFEVAGPTVNLGHIHGGDNPNRICADCELHIDIRPLPGMHLDPLREDLHKRVQHVLTDSGLRVSYKPLFDGIPAMETDASSEIVKAAERLTGHDAKAVAFGTEGPYLNAMGMETIILGPGSIDQAHQPDEYMPLDQIDPGKKIIQQLVRQFCL
ncbi:MAG: acetylornithine deacetylase [bacterium]